jgi:hypothetical protein
MTKSAKYMSTQTKSISIPRDIGFELENFYSFNTEKDIAIFFQEYPHLIDIISKSIEIIVSYFTEDQLCLKVRKDLGYDSFDKLSIIIKTHLDPFTVSKKLSDLDEDFSLSNITNDILVHVEFQ